MRSHDRKEILAAALLLLAGLLFRVALSRRAPLTADSLRFLAQADDLSAGTRWVVPGDPFSVLPPGYPLFIRAMGWIRPGVPFLLNVHLLLSVGTLLLVWLAARRRSREGALVALALLALNPWLARQQALVFSETLGAFLVAVTVLLWPAPGRPLADLQDPPEAIPALLSAATPGVDAVLAAWKGRYEGKGRLLTSRVFKILREKLTGYPRDAGMFLALRRPLVEEILRDDVSHPFLPSLVGLSGRHFVTVPIERAARSSGESAYSPAALLLRATRELAFIFRRSRALRRV